MSLRKCRGGYPQKKQERQIPLVGLEKVGCAGLNWNGI